MRSKPYTSKPSFISDSWVDVRRKYDTTFEKMTSRYANTTGTKVETDTDANFDHPNYPKPDYSFTEGKQDKKHH